MPRQYKVEFDSLEGHAPNTNGDIESSALHPVGWRSIGEPTGAAIANNTGTSLTACYLKTNKPGDTFAATAQSAGKLFTAIWLKNDLTEVYFLGADIPAPVGSSFWMRVPANDQTDIEACNQCQFTPPPADPDCLQACPFTGQVFTSDPPDPPVAMWTKIVSSSS